MTLVVFSCARFFVLFFVCVVCGDVRAVRFVMYAGSVSPRPLRGRGSTSRFTDLFGSLRFQSDRDIDLPVRHQSRPFQHGWTRSLRRGPRRVELASCAVLGSRAQPWGGRATALPRRLRRRRLRKRPGRTLGTARRPAPGS